jgi:hypothetical protein
MCICVNPGAAASDRKRTPVATSEIRLLMVAKNLVFILLSFAYEAPIKGALLVVVVDSATLLYLGPGARKNFHLRYLRYRFIPGFCD